MWKAFKNIVILFLILIVSAGIYWLVYLDKESKGDVLEYAMSLLGNDLMAMVPESIDKKEVRERYDELVSHAKQQKIEPAQLETLASNIMNLRNSQRTITPQQAEAILHFSTSTPLKIERITSDPIESKAEKHPSPERWKTGCPWASPWPNAAS